MLPSDVRAQNFTKMPRGHWSHQGEGGFPGVARLVPRPSHLRLLGHPLHPGRPDLPSGLPGEAWNPFHLTPVDVYLPGDL